MTGKHIRTTLIQAELFPQLGCDEVAQLLGIGGKNIDQYQRYATLPYFLYPLTLCRKLPESTYIQTILVEPNLRRAPHQMNQTNRQTKKKTNIFQTTSHSPLPNHSTASTQMDNDNTVNS